MPPDEDVSMPEVVRWLKRIDGRLDELTRSFVSREVFDVQDRMVKDHEKRLRVVERWMLKAIGAGVVLGGASGALASRLIGG